MLLELCEGYVPYYIWPTRIKINQPENMKKLPWHSINGFGDDTCRVLLSTLSFYTMQANKVQKHKLRFIFYILVTVHLGIILISNQLGAQLYIYIYISILYMFRANLCSSSGESIVSISVYIVSLYVTLCRWPSGIQVGKFLPELYTGRSPTQSDIPDVVLIQLTLLMMSTKLLETCRESK